MDSEAFNPDAANGFSCLGGYSSQGQPLQRNHASARPCRAGKLTMHGHSFDNAGPLTYDAARLRRAGIGLVSSTEFPYLEAMRHSMCLAYRQNGPRSVFARQPRRASGVVSSAHNLGNNHRPKPITRKGREECLGNPRLQTTVSCNVFVSGRKLLALVGDPVLRALV